jgi:hypothetical protein
MYYLHVPGMIESYYQDVQVTRQGSGPPPRTLAVIWNTQCGRACAVEGARGPLVGPPACLFSPRP